MGRTQRKRRLRKRTFESLKCDTNMINLYKWLNFNKWQNFTEVFPARFEQTGRGLTSKRKIHANGTLLEIPFKLLMTYVTLKHSKIFLQIDTSVKLTIHEALVAFLIYEKNKGEDSLWYEYIAMLPNSYINCTECTENEINLLPELLKLYILNQREKIKKSFCNVTLAFKNSEIKQMLTKEMLSWAYWAINTRAVYVDPNIIKKLSDHLPLNEIFPLKINGQTNHENVTVNYDFLKGEPNMAMAPLFDLFNHGIYTDTKAKFSKNFSFKLITLSTFLPYDEHIISYGPHDNMKLLCEYGFIVEKNHFDTIQFELNYILKVHGSEMTYRQRVYVFSKLELDKKLYISYDGISYNLFILLYILTHENVAQWDYKIYSNDYTAVEKQLVHVLAKKISENVLNDYNQIKRNIEEYREQNKVCKFFQMAILYVDECINLINFVIDKYL